MISCLGQSVYSTSPLPFGDKKEKDFLEVVLGFQEVSRVIHPVQYDLLFG